MARADIRQLFDQLAPDLQRFLTSRVTCEATAADLTQEAFLRLAQIPNLEAIENLRTYLFRIANNLVIDHHRARARTRCSSPEDESALVEYPDAAATPEAAILAKEELAVVLQALEELSPLCRRIFILNRFEGLPHREIAARLGIHLSTVEKNIARALNHCRQRLNESGG
ncbi:MAG TPA: RNA polymerase sigma factor [Nitrospiraceae bacterium]|nr:RNA polymerase sigma factor [Nitrospiraceae bacterium]